MKVQIQNVMTYRYEKAVAFSPHVVRLYPRTDQGIVTHRLSTSINLESDIQYRKDLFDNLIANCFLPVPGETLNIQIDLEIELKPKNPFHFLIARHGTTLPFEYTEAELRVLEPYRKIRPEDEAETDELWSPVANRDTVEALVDLAATLHSEIGYEVRQQGDARPPSRVLELRSGACRDTALLCAVILRKAGLAARLVSGFLCEFHVDVKDRRAESGLHAWVEVFLPGAGWVGLDPTNGTFCDHRFIPTAVGVNMIDIAPVEGSYFGAEHVPSTFDAHLDLSLVTERSLPKLAEQVEATLATEKVILTLGGEPTFIPLKPEGEEWNFTAVGGTKLDYAYEFAERVSAEVWPGALVVYTPGKLYPGEINPRWALNVLRADEPFANAIETTTKLDERWVKAFRDELIGFLKIDDRWIKARDPAATRRAIWVLPLDFKGGVWLTDRWSLKRLDLTAAEGAAGLRLPLYRLPENALRRALVIEPLADRLEVFIPPLLSAPFDILVRAILKLASSDCRIRWLGYAPIDLPSAWSQIGFSADPGVLEVNLPACQSWQTYYDWLITLEKIGREIGLRTFRQSEAETGTGGGCHLLFGGATLGTNPFFTRPRWIAAILRFWQHHPSLAYLFTGAYVGKASQAPRPDESGHSLLDLELAYRQLEDLPAGDARHLVHEILRHLHTDAAGNTHRSEISFDKFWTAPAGLLGLIEFRAIESLPNPEWTGAVILFWRALLAYLLKQGFTEPLRDWGPQLHDRYFLPAFLWTDFTAVLTELAQFGFCFDPAVFREIWHWRFPTLLQVDGLVVRRALEGWELLSETPAAGGTTSRFVDGSIHRLEFVATREFHQEKAVHINGRELPFRSVPSHEFVAGLRYRKTLLYPSLHPRFPVQLPLQLTIVERESGAPWKQFELGLERPIFVPKMKIDFSPGQPCEPATPGLYTCDLRIEQSLFGQDR